MKAVEIIYKKKTANVNEIQSHLQRCSDQFFPPLIERIDIEDYSQKIFENAITFEAWKGGRLVGLLAAYIVDGSKHSVFVTNVSVLKDFMGLGIASSLLDDCIRCAVEACCIVVNLDVHKGNARAINFYRKFDFKKVDELNGEVLRMRLELADRFDERRI